MSPFKRRKCSVRQVVGSVFLILTSIPTAQADSQSDNNALLTIERLKDSVVNRLASCETKGRPDADSVIVVDTNNEASIGRLQFQPNTVVNYTKLFEGRSIDRREAIQIASNGQRASELAKRIIFEKDGVGNWHVCSKKLGLVPEIKVIQWMMK